MALPDKRGPLDLRRELQGLGIRTNYANELQGDAAPARTGRPSTPGPSSPLGDRGSGPLSPFRAPPSVASPVLSPVGASARQVLPAAAREVRSAAAARGPARDARSPDVLLLDHVMRPRTSAGASTAGGWGLSPASPTLASSPGSPETLPSPLAPSTSSPTLRPSNPTATLARTKTASTPARAPTYVSPLHAAKTLQAYTDGGVPTLEERTTMTLSMTRSPSAETGRVATAPAAGPRTSHQGNGHAHLSADVSFLDEKVGVARPGASSLSEGAALELEPPPTIIPTDFHIVESATAIPAGESANDWVKNSTQMFVKQLFPSLRPTGRREAVMLSELLDRLMAGFEAHKGTMPPRELIKESQKIHSMCMFELVRQVTVQCGERGVLLKRIWEGYGELFDSLWKATQDMLDAMQRHYDDILAALRLEIQELIRRIKELENKLRGKDDEIVVLEEEVKRLRAGLMTDDVRDRLEFLEGENTRLRDELGRLKTAFMEMTQLLAQLRADLERLTKENEALLAQLAAMIEENAVLKTRLAELEAENAKLKELLASLLSENERLKGQLAESKSQLSAALALVKDLQAKLMEALKALALANSQIPKKKDLRSISCQTDPMVIELAPPPPAEPEEKAVVKKKKKKLNIVEAPPWPLTNALKAIQGIYVDKIKADAVDDAVGNARQNMVEYVEDWFKNQYGTGTMVKEVQSKFAATLNKFRDSNMYCAVFGRLWGLFDGLDESWCDYYLEILSRLVDARASTEEVALPTKGNLGFMVKLKFLSDLVKEYFSIMLEPRFLANFQMKLAALGEKFGTKGLKYVDQERFMSLCLDERKAMFARMGKTLANLFVAGDTNGDGILDIDEFTCIVRYVDVTAPDAKIAVMHKEATEGGEGEGAMTPDDFVRVCLNNGLLDSAAAKARLQSEFENEDDKSIEELFGEVTAKWEPRRVEFLQRVAEVEDSEVREALQSRIAHYDQLVAAGEEPEVASIARRLTVMEILKHTAEVKAVAATVNMVMKLKSWKNKAEAKAASSEGGDDGREVLAPAEPKAPTPKGFGGLFGALKRAPAVQAQAAAVPAPQPEAAEEAKEL